MSVLRKIKPAVCRQCPLYPAKMVMSDGPPDAARMWVGEAPAWNEVREGRNFVGRAGQYWSGLLHDVAIDRDEDYVANAIKCEIPPTMKKHSKQVNRAIACCRKRLAVEIRRVKPKLIIGMGDIAARSLIGKSGITRFRGEFHKAHPVLEGAPPVFLTFHPAHLLRGKEHLRRVVIEDFKKTLRFLAGKPVDAQDPVHYHYCTSFGKALRLFALLRQPRHRRIFIDSETSAYHAGLGRSIAKATSILKAQVFMLSFCVRTHEAWVLPLYAERLDDFWTPEQLEVIEQNLVELFHDPEKRWWIQNLPFDVPFFHKRLAARGFDVLRMRSYDLLVVAGLINENDPKDLESLALCYSSLGNYKVRLAKKLAEMLKTQKAKAQQAQRELKLREKAG